MATSLGTNVEPNLATGRWEIIASDLLEKSEIEALSKALDTDILSAIPLKICVGDVRARAILDALKYRGVYPEVDLEGRRRCIHIHHDSGDNKIRCTKYSKEPVCKRHWNMVKASTPSIFKSPALKEAFDHYWNSKAQLSLKHELVMQRTMLFALTQKVEKDEIPIDMIASITAMCDKIGSTVERMNKVNAITPETIDRLLEGVIEILAEYVPAEKLIECADKIKSINPAEEKVCLPFEPSKETQVQDIQFKLDNANIQKKALIKLSEELKTIEAETITDG